MSNMQNIVERLRLLEADQEIINLGLEPRDYLSPDQVKNQEQLKHLAYLISDTLITNSGQLDYAKIDILKRHGFQVYCVERDSFGWLVGAVRTKVGSIIFS